MLKTDYIFTKGDKEKRITDFNWNYILYTILAFLMGRASIMGRLTPFGLAFSAAYILWQRKYTFVLFSTILGILSFHGLKGIDYVITIIIIWIVFNRFRLIKTYTHVQSSMITGMVLILTKFTTLLVSRNISIYGIFVISFEGLVVFTLNYVFLHGFSIGLKDKDNNNERYICSIITLALVLSGLQDYAILGASVKNIASILFILYYGYAEGAFVAASIGMVMGMISYVSQPEMPFLIAIYGLSGLLAGVFRDLGKVGSILGFFLGSGIISFYINGFGISFLSIREIIASIILFSILYNPLGRYLSINAGLTTKRSKENSYCHRRDQMAINRLDEMALVFNQLGTAFKNSAKDQFSYDATEVYEMVDNMANSICADCSMKKFCWGENFYTTYNSIFSTISLLEEKKPLKDENLPRLIRDYCINKETIKKEIRNHFERFKISNAWKEKIIENRLLISEQLMGVSKIIDDTSKKLYINPLFREDLEEVLYMDLKNNDINVLEAIVVELDDKDLEAYIEIDRPYKKENSLEHICRVASNALEMELRGEPNLNKLNKGKQIFKLTKCNRYNAITEVVSKINYNNQISGDNYTFGENHNNYYVALSDGMGVGKRANNESNIAINLYEKLLEAKFDNELALKTINSILMLKSNDEVFTTLDISLIDLYSGKLQVIKTGASPTFIRKKDKVEVISSQSLPVGILKDVVFNVYEEYLEDGDIIIMMSDGILEANQNTNSAEKWVKEIILGIDNLNPRKIADEIMIAAKKACKGEVKDDMTLLVTKVWKVL